MHLVQLLLPLYDQKGKKITGAAFQLVQRELTSAFGGVTAYSHAPATGLWKRSRGDVERDRIILIEVVVKEVKQRWWREYLRILEKRFNQKTLMDRTLKITTL